MFLYRQNNSNYINDVVVIIHKSSEFYWVVQPMERRNSECIKLKKELKDMWGREQKKLSECKAALKAAKSKYTLLGQELARVSCK